MKIGIVGLPNVGKSTLFNSITKAGAESANYPFCTIEPNIGIAEVPDYRLDVLEKMYNSKKKTHAVVEFVDIAGLVKGASKGEGLGNQFLSNIRECDAIVHVIRAFDITDIVHVESTVDPVRDIEIIRLELILSDLSQVEKRLPKLEKQSKQDKTLIHELNGLNKIYDVLKNEKMAKEAVLTEKEIEAVKGMGLLTMKEELFVANISEDDISNPENSEYYMSLKKYLQKEKGSINILPISVKLEEELSELEDNDKKEMLEAMGLKESGLDMLIKEAYRTLGLMSFLTAGEDEVRAWTIKNGTTAPKAAGKIHTDIERGFIKAEIVSYNDLIECGSYNKAKEKGLIRLEGKEYIMKEGDIALFKFNV